MTDTRTLNVSTDGLDTIEAAFAWAVTTLDDAGLGTPSIEIKAYWTADDDYERVLYSACVWGELQ